MDGGVREGGHVFKALAMGAKAVFIAIWGLVCKVTMFRKSICLLSTATLPCMCREVMKWRKYWIS